MPPTWVRFPCAVPRLWDPLPSRPYRLRNRGRPPSLACFCLADFSRIRLHPRRSFCRWSPRPRLPLAATFLCCYLCSNLCCYLCCCLCSNLCCYLCCYLCSNLCCFSPRYPPRRRSRLTPPPRYPPRRRSRLT